MNLVLRVVQDILQQVQNITPILRTETLKELLMELFFNSDAPRTLTDLATAIDVSQTTVMREVNRLLETGVVKEERVGRSRTVTIDLTSPLAAPLRNLMSLARETPVPVADGGDDHERRSHGRPGRRPLPSSRTRPS